MLQSLDIQNFILISSLHIDFKKGFCAITGETGAGKSLMLDALLFTFGSKANTNLIKNGESKAIVTAIFDLTNIAEQFLEEYDIESSDDEIIIMRSLDQNSKSKIFINNQLVTRKIAQELFDILIEMHGQHSSTSLLDKNEHIKILDEFECQEDLLSSVREIASMLGKLKKEISAALGSKKQIEEEIDYLKHSCKELETLDIQENEASHLREKKHQLQSLEKEIALSAALINDFRNIAFEELVVNSTKKISKSLYSDKYNDTLHHLEKLYDHGEHIKSNLQTIYEEISYSDENLESVDDRLNSINEMARKHNCAPDDLLKIHENYLCKLELLSNKIIGCDALEKEYSKNLDEYKKLANKLTLHRIKSSKQLEIRAMDELKALDMGRAKFYTKISTDTNKISLLGNDEVIFEASTNPGALPGPIDLIASGGELSRFMLALRVALMKDHFEKVIIFDEIDVGVSGSVAASIGSKIKQISAHSQVLAITHQPQVAGLADMHILVNKKQSENHTIVEIKEIKSDSRAREIARMISGKSITTKGIEAAKELIG